MWSQLDWVLGHRNTPNTDSPIPCLPDFLLFPPTFKQLIEFLKSTFGLTEMQLAQSSCILPTPPQILYN